MDSVDKSGREAKEGKGWTDNWDAEDVEEVEDAAKTAEEDVQEVCSRDLRWTGTWITTETDGKKERSENNKVGFWKCEDGFVENNKYTTNMEVSSNESKGESRDKNCTERSPNYKKLFDVSPEKKDLKKKFNTWKENWREVKERFKDGGPKKDESYDGRSSEGCKRCDISREMTYNEDRGVKDDVSENTSGSSTKSDVKNLPANVEGYGLLSCYSFSAVSDLLIVGWRCLYLALKTMETALALSPRSSPYSLDLICSLAHLSLPPSRYEIQERFKDNYAAFSGEYYCLLRSLVCLSVCRYASPGRVFFAIGFFVLCGFIPLQDCQVGPYLMPGDIQRVFLCIISVCISGIVDVIVWCLVLALPLVLLHLILHDTSSSSHKPLFRDILWS